MTRNHLIRLSGGIALFSMLLLLYWVFAFCCVSVFGLKVFGQNMTETFGLSIFGILSLLAGSLIVNVVLNLTKIANSLAGEVSPSGSGVSQRHRSKLMWFVLAGLFPVIALALFAGDWASAKRKEQRLMHGARAMLRENARELEALAEYSFTPGYVNRAAETLKLLSRINERSPQVMVIVEEQTPERRFILAFENHSSWESSGVRTRAEFVYPCSPEEREYLLRVFEGQESNHRFSASDGRYELYLPAKIGNRTIVMYFSDWNRYGKLGS